MVDALRLIPESAAQDACSVVELYCNNQLIDNDLDLATIKHYMWKRSSDLEIKYQLRPK